MREGGALLTRRAVVPRAVTGFAATGRRVAGDALQTGVSMQGPAKGCLAGLISWKLGGGILSTIVIFVIVYSLLGHC